jgi:hypothetical protein
VLEESGKRVHWNTMPSLSPDPGFDYFFKACRKGDAATKAVTVGDSAVRVLADASEITGWTPSSLIIHQLYFRRLPSAFARRKDGGRFRLRPVEAHDEVDQVVGGREPVALFVRAGAVFLDVERHRAVGVFLHAG